MLYFRLALLSTVCLAAANAATPALAARAGVTAAVNQSALGTPPGGAVRTIVLGAARPSLFLGFAVSKKTRVTIELLAHSKVIASWHEHAAKGRARLRLLVPPKARRPGTDTLEIFTAGGKAQSYAITLKD